VDDSGSSLLHGIIPRKTKNIFSQYSWSSCQNVNLGLPQHEAGVLITEPQCLIEFQDCTLSATDVPHS
jgi:hypothetical protein